MDTENTRTDRTLPHVPIPYAITATVPVGWTWDNTRTDRTLPHVPIPYVITATVPVGWTWDNTRTDKWQCANRHIQRGHYMPVCMVCEAEFGVDGVKGVAHHVFRRHFFSDDQK
ncbi:hypothetical protein AVEN_56392-1 [Araneus ventricosus]|uniref:Uncharacterized protein n=1 Tax=Araneus ventricosus TaxID=182803 RepID=A0A4Y2SKD9_ARAVE|nr:hypothetical protein AVEN_56392-1 [Araneus ventricosus]